MTRPSFDVVVPTIGRPSLRDLLRALERSEGPPPTRVILVDDRPPAQRRTTPLDVGTPGTLLADRLRVLPGPATGPAAARNVGWGAAGAEWIAFVDDDVLPGPRWLAELADDLAAARADVGGVQGRIQVPLPPGRRPTDWERNTAGLEQARWATADLAYRRAALVETGGFDERFPRAYREDAELGLRMVDCGWRIVLGARTVLHPARPADWLVSVRMQRGNADDVLMAALHGRDWRDRAGAPAGRRRAHLATTAAGMLAGVSAVRGSRSGARAGGALWLALTAQFAWRRIAPGPRTPREIATMAVTSAAVPVAATAHWLDGWLRLPRRLAQTGPVAGTVPRPLPEAVLFDRDGTLVRDVPYNGDPARVKPLPGARRAVARVRAAGIPTAVVSNQSGVARGLLTPAQVRAVNARVDELLGPFDAWFVCPHGPDDGCHCRKPAPGLVKEAAAALGTAPERCVLIGDIGADVDAALAAGARPILVPTAQTLAPEVAGAPEVARDLDDAVDRALGGSR